MTTQLGRQLTLGASDPGQELDDVTRQPNRATVVGHRAGNGLTNPPVDVGAESEAPPPVELIDASLQADVAFLDQVEERHAPPNVAARNRNDQPQVALDQALACPLAVLGRQLELLTQGGIERLVGGGQLAHGESAGLEALS